MIALLFIWLMMAVIVAIIANSRGRDPMLWGLYGFVIWPVALTHILVSKPNE